MRKVHMIENDSYSDLESEINRFIKDKNVINVGVSPYQVGYNTYYTAFILYEV